MWSHWDQESRSPQRDTWLDAFEKNITISKFESLYIPTLTARCILPIIMANSFEWTLSQEQFQAGGALQPHSKTDYESMLREREQNFFSNYSSTHTTVSLSQLARLGFSHEKSKKYQYSNLMLVLLRTLEAITEKESKKTFIEKPNYEEQAVKKELTLIINDLEPVVGTANLQQMTQQANTLAQKSWAAISADRASFSNQANAYLPVVLVDPYNIVDNKRLFDRLKNCAFVDIHTVKEQEQKPLYVNFHQRLGLGFTEAGLMLEDSGHNYLANFTTALINVMTARGLLENDDTYKTNLITTFINSIGTPDSISFSRVAESIASVCDNLHIISESIGVGHTLVIETMAVLIAKEKITAHNSSILKKLRLLLTKLSQDDYAYCFSIAGIYPPHIFSSYQQAQNNPAVPSRNQSFSSLSVASDYHSKIPIIDTNKGGWQYDFIKCCALTYVEFKKVMRSLLSEIQIDDIEVDHHDSEERKFQMLSVIKNAARIAELQNAFSFTNGQLRCILK